MEANLNLRFDCQDATNRQKIISILESDTRPCFADEVPSEYRYIFEALEYVESPNSIKTVGGTTIHAYYFLHGDYEEDMCDLLVGLIKVGVRGLVAYSEADEEIIFMYEKNGKLTQFNKWDEDRVDAARGEEDIIYAYLDELSKTLYAAND